MKLETVILIAKGACYLTVGAGVAWSSSLAQWVNSGEWPEKIAWAGIIIPASIIGAANGLLAFLSGSYSTYMKERNGKPPAQDKTMPETKP
jgi:hypothetical protein